MNVIRTIAMQLVASVAGLLLSVTQAPDARLSAEPPTASLPWYEEQVAGTDSYRSGSWWCGPCADRRR